MLCKLGHQDTHLAPESLNPKTTQVGKAGERRQRKCRPEGAQGDGAAREPGDQAPREKALGRDGGEMAQEEKQTENNVKEQKTQRWRSTGAAWPRQQEREITSAAGFWTDKDKQEGSPSWATKETTKTQPLPSCYVPS